MSQLLAHFRRNAPAISQQHAQGYAGGSQPAAGASASVRSHAVADSPTPMELHPMPAATLPLPPLDTSTPTAVPALPVPAGPAVATAVPAAVPASVPAFDRESMSEYLERMMKAVKVRFELVVTDI